MGSVEWGSAMAGAMADTVQRYVGNDPGMLDCYWPKTCPIHVVAARARRAVNEILSAIQRLRPCRFATSSAYHDC